MKITPGVYETRGGDTATVRDADWDADGCYEYWYGELSTGEHMDWYMCGTYLARQPHGYDLIKRIGDLPKSN